MKEFDCFQLNKGLVIWITGLSGVGKTVIGKTLTCKLRAMGKTVVFLDGDELRKVFDSFDYSIEQRKKLAYRYGSLCKLLSDQGINVVCATVSLFKDVQEWNRRELGSNYIEVLIECDPIELLSRDPKGLYKGAKEGKVKYVVGADLPFDKPVAPDVVIDNSKRNGLEEKVDLILQVFLRRTG